MTDCHQLWNIPTDIWGFPKMELPKNGWFIKEHPMEMDSGIVTF